MATFSREEFSEAGLASITFNSANAGGDKVDNGDQRAILVIKNDDSSSHTVTVSAQVSNKEDSAYGDLVKQDASVTVGAGDIGVLGPFPRASFNDSNGDINISYDAVTSLSIGVIYQE